MSPALFIKYFWEAQSSHELTSDYAKKQLKLHFPEKQDVLDFVERHKLGRLIGMEDELEVKN